MLHFEAWKKVLILGVCLLGIVFALPNLFYERADDAERARADIAAGRFGHEGQPSLDDLVATAAKWPAFLPPDVVNLGLDLRGGVHLLVDVQVDEVVSERLDRLAADIRDVLRDAGVRRRSAPRIVSDRAVEVRITNPQDVQTAETALRGMVQNVGGFGLSGGVSGDDLDVEMQDDQVIRLSLTDAEIADITERTMQQSLEIVRRRIDESGTREPTIQRQDQTRILIQVPGLNSADELLALIGKTAKLTFHKVLGVGVDAANPGPGEFVAHETATNDSYLLEKRAILTGENLVDSSLGFHPDTGLPTVNFRFDQAGSRIFGKYTSANIGQLFAIVLDGDVISAPRIQSAILGGAGFIEGRFSVDEATNLSILLRAGALPASIKVLEQRTVGPDLGADSIAAGKAATLLAFGAVLVFMVLAYRRFGIYANIALLVNVGLIFAFLSVIGATLTLPGIAGIVLTIGMAVDANVLIFERIREEMKTAKGVTRAIERGYEQAFSAIVDANITTFIAAAILFSIGSGPVKGFAVTLGVGIVTSVFTAILVTRLMIAGWVRRNRPKTLDLRGLRIVPDETHLDFMRLRPLMLGLSGAALIGAVVLTGISGLNFGIDFRGGTMVEVQTPQAADLGQIRSVVSKMDLGDVAVQSFGSPRDVLVRVEEQQGDGDTRNDVAALIGENLQQALPGTEIRRVEVVGPKVSGELLQSGVLAVGLAILAILIYIWLRFEWQFGLGAVVALIHDVVLTVGIFSLLQIEFNLSIIAAVLTIVGYSLNDTVIVFDRVRENLRKYKQMPLAELLNLSVNETLSRTLMTSLTTLIALIAMFLLGPPVIQGFTFAMIWGIVVGTYSSIFIAAAILLWLGIKRDWSSTGGKDTKAGVNYGGAQV